MTSAITDASIEANSTPHIADPYGHVYYTRSGTTSYVLSASGFDFYFGSSLESIPSGEPPFQKAIYQNYPPGSDISGGNYVYTGTDVLAFGGNLAIYKADGTPFSAISILLDPSYRFDVNDEIDVTGYDSNGASHAEQFHLNSQSQLQSIPINLSGLTVLNIYSSNWLLFDGFTYEDGTQVPEITVLGNGVTILDGDTTPSTTDGSDFGTTTLGGAGVTHTFTVRNDGNATLTTSAPSLPTGFTLVEGLSSSIAAGGSDTFTVRLDTTSAGFKSGQISFTDNDSDENPFNFTITGTVISSDPEITVLGNGVTILDGDTTPSTTDGSDFGTTTLGGASVTHTFTVRNDGNATLTTSAPSLPTGFTLVEGLSSSIAAGGSDTFTVRLDTTSTGFKSGQISFADNDSDENPFNFAITGTVLSPPVTLYTFGFFYNDMIANPFGGDDYYGTVAADSSFGYFVNQKITTSFGYYWIIGSLGTTGQPSGRVAIEGYDDRAGTPPKTYNPYYYSTLGYSFGTGLGNEYDILGPEGAYHAIGANRAEYIHIPPTVTAPPDDFYLTGSSGILWQNTDGTAAIWKMNGATPTAAPVVGNPGAAWQVAGSGDFNRDGYADILWQNTDGTVAFWEMNGGTAIAAPVIGNPGASWRAVGTGEFIGEGFSGDILWRNTDGRVAIWELNGKNVTAASVIGNPGTSWRVAGTGDFYGNGYSDILWQNSDGTVAIWAMNGATPMATPVIGKPGASWKAIGAGDFNRDGYSDILWQNTNGAVAIWEMNGATVIAAPVIGNPGTSWHPILGGGSSTIVAGSAGAASASSAGGAGFGFGDNRRSRPHPERNRRERRHHAGISERRQRSASASARFDDAACRPHHTSGHPLRVMRR